MKKFWAGFVFCFFICACAGVSFPYRYYIVDADSYEGTLKGEKESDDLPFEICLPDNSDLAPCTVMRSKDFLKLKLEFQDLQLRLQKCEQGFN